MGDAVAAQLAQSAELLRADDEALDALAGDWIERQAAACPPGVAPGTLSLSELAYQSDALQRRILRLWLMRGARRRPRASPHRNIRKARAKDGGLTWPGDCTSASRPDVLVIWSAQPHPCPPPKPALAGPERPSARGLMHAGAGAHGILREPGHLGMAAAAPWRATWSAPA